MSKKRPVSLLVSALLLLAAVSVAAQDGLYAPSAPEDASLVRVINATAGAPSLTMDIGPVRFKGVPALTGSAYRPVNPGVYLLFGGSEPEVFMPEKALFYTVVKLPDGIRIFSEERHTDPARAQLILYNTTSTKVHLDAIKPEARILESVDPSASGARIINAIPVTVSVTTDGRQSRDAMDLVLVRGASYAIVAYEADDSVRFFMVEAAVQPE